MSTCNRLDLETLGISTDYAQNSPRTLVAGITAKLFELAESIL